MAAIITPYPLLNKKIILQKGLQCAPFVFTFDNRPMKRILLVLLFLPVACVNAQTWYPLGTGLDDYPNVIFPDTTDHCVYAGGHFKYVNGKLSQGIAKWNGTTWEDIGYGTDANSITAIIRYKGYIYAGGRSSTMDSTVHTTQGLARWDGKKWESVGDYEANKSKDIVGIVSNLKIYNDELWVMGNFDSIGGVKARGIAKFNGQTWSAVVPDFLDPQANWSTIEDAVYYKNELYLSGNFVSKFGKGYEDILRWDGKNFHSLGQGLDGADSQVDVMCIYKGELYAAGYFRRQMGNPADYLAKWNGERWSPVDSGSGINTQVMALFSYDDKLLVGGQFDLVNDMDVRGFVAWDGHTWSEPARLYYTSKGASALAFAAMDNHLYIGGQFKTVDTTKAHDIAWWSYTAPVSATPMLKLPEYNMFPNPAKSFLQLEGVRPGTEIKVYNNVGQLQHAFTASKEKENINVSEWTRGIYILQFESTTGIATRRFIKE